MVQHFVEIARHGYQFERFEDAWCAWADADAAMDWTQEQLLEAVVELLRAADTSATSTSAAAQETRCRRAEAILARFGTAFSTWMDDNIAAGNPLDAFTTFAAPTAEPGVEQLIGELLAERYATYTEVSYRLRILVSRLGDLRNTYPRATLHDCDAGSDFNPVRLGQTALGSS
jgi:hypothetical protein